ncbi:zinc chelation protein SecC [Sulfurimonas lithotrophica]|uniref:Zinc chelation protein SecC n=1 Tax=Sulfurimonas lithotrophica TaxID=2590022 RepID=A0A5P8P389_9BACT|nr:YchJ family metal-binding protein [Sulfurimonas lithotrophica]QFR50223.1 zinc chelation protein SecC [Sulfurimonas lithotrophica]
MKKIETPLELMKSRYDAFVRRDGEYLARTTTKKISSDMSGYENIEWLKLDILDAKDDEVEFKAYYKDNDVLGVLHERSKFVKVDGEWLYDSGELFNTKIQRNEACPCGSGRKYKKCCV